MINNEYYLDMFCKYLLERDYKINFIRVKNIYKYGTPAEYREAINLTKVRMFCTNSVWFY